MKLTAQSDCARVVRKLPVRDLRNGSEAVGGRDHRRRALVDRVNDLGVVDPRSYTDVIAKSAWPSRRDDKWRNPVARHLDRRLQARGTRVRNRSIA